MNKFKFICTACGTTGKPKRITKGYFIIEIILWLLFFPLGLIYTIWRISTKYDVCPQCKHDAMIPINSPRGLKIRDLMLKKAIFAQQNL